MIALFKWLRYYIASWLLLHGPKPIRRLIAGLYTLVVDIWEGNIDLNPDALWDGGVRGVIIRINSISGAHHLDDLFNRYWALFARFIKFPYFVYNPYASAQANFDWLKANLPPGVKRVAIDVEVRRDGYSPTVYAAEVDKFIKLVQGAGYIPVIYTGAWFLPLLAYWPKNVEYWWARYPYSMYPPTSINITWADLRARLEALAWYPAQPGIIPGLCNIWQCSGDRFKLPGTGARTIDICVANMTVEQYKTWVDEQIAPPPPLSWADRITVWARQAVSPTGGYKDIGPGPIWPG
jgi:hypothetical protein